MVARLSSESIALLLATYRETKSTAAAAAAVGVARWTAQRYVHEAGIMRPRSESFPRNLQHGHTTGGQSITYVTWQNMLKRCTNPNRRDYRWYGGRGIRVCERWWTFTNFLSDMGEQPPGLTLERNHNDRDYSPENCRWATRAEQRRNQRNSNQYSSARV